MIFLFFVFFCNWDEIYAYMSLYIIYNQSYNVFSMYSSYIEHSKIGIYNYFKVGMVRSWLWTDLRFSYTVKWR